MSAGKFVGAHAHARVKQHCASEIAPGGLFSFFSYLNETLALTLLKLCLIRQCISVIFLNQ